MRARKYSQTASRKLGQKLIQVETSLKEGNNSQEIVKTAKERQFDLIVIGARGMYRLTGFRGQRHGRSSETCFLFCPGGEIRRIQKRARRHGARS
jgi:nucleotide-binding universal stress UspA family protein